MFRVRHFLMALSLALFPLGCAPAGCSGEDPEQDKSAAEQFEGAMEQKLTAPAPNAPSFYGTWNGDTVGGHFSKLVLMTDGRFHSEEAVICVKAPCPAITKDGTFRLFTRESRSYLELTATGAAQVPTRLEYALNKESLRVRPLVVGSEWYEMKHSGIAWCGTVRDCGAQALPTGPCAGDYACNTNTCAWQCAGTPTPTSADQKAADPNAPSAVGDAGGTAPTPTDAQLCPSIADCAVANTTCTSNARDPSACATVTSCQRCFPNGWNVKKVPEIASPIVNPVLK